MGVCLRIATPNPDVPDSVAALIHSLGQPLPTCEAYPDNYRIIYPKPLLDHGNPFHGGAREGYCGFSCKQKHASGHPDSLGGIVLGQKIKLMTRDGTYAEGKVIRASQTEITMEIRESEPKGRLLHPEAIIPTSDIGTVYLVKNGTIAAPVALGVAAGFAGAFAAAYSAENVHSDAGFISIMLLGAAGGATGGAILGREMAKKTLQINITEPRARSAESRTDNLDGIH
jgi:hypothetical protein